MWRTGPGRKCKTAWIAVTWRSRSQGASESLVLKITSALCFLRIRYFGERWEEARECWRGWVQRDLWVHFLWTTFISEVPFYFYHSDFISSIQFYKIIPSERPGNVCNVILIVLFSQNFCVPILLLQFRFISTILILFLAFSSTKLFTKPVPSETWQRVQCGFDSFVFPEACCWYTKILFYKFIVSEAWLQSTGIPFSEFNFRIGNWMFYRNFFLKMFSRKAPLVA